jgi:hypothetical protein
VTVINIGGVGTPITDPNETTIIDVEKNGTETETTEIPFVNDTAVTINIEEFQTCVDIFNQSNLQMKREMKVNTLDPYWIDILKNESTIMMQNCIYLNNANEEEEQP